MSRAAHAGRWWRHSGLLLLAAALTACAGRGAMAPGSATQGVSDAARPEPMSAQAVAQALQAFEQRQRAAALAAEQQGLWSEAAWAWETVYAVRPADEAVAVRLRQARAAAESRAALLTQQARLSLQLNDSAAARELFVRALAVLPSHADAMDGLRALEEARLRERWAAPGPVRSQPPRMAALQDSAAFASLLVAQGELEKAANLLLPGATARQPDPSLRLQLSDIYLIWAERLHASDPAAAMATLRKSLQMDPRNSRAARHLRDWQKPARSRPQSRAATP